MTVSQYLAFGLQILLKTLGMALPKSRVAWPAPEEFVEYNELIAQPHPLLEHGVGSLDGLVKPSVCSCPRQSFFPVSEGVRKHGVVGA